MSFSGEQHGLRSLDPQKVRIRVAGVDLVGFGRQKISVRPSVDAWKIVVGCEGEAARVQSKDSSGTITVTLQQSSPSNQFLSALFFVDKALAQVFPVWIYNTDGFLANTKIIALKAWIERMPKIDYTNKVEDVVWTFRTDSLQYILHGNKEPGQMNTGTVAFPDHEKRVDGQLASPNVFGGSNLPFHDNGTPYGDDSTETIVSRAPGEANEEASTTGEE